MSIELTEDEILMELGRARAYVDLGKTLATTDLSSNSPLVIGIFDQAFELVKSQMVAVPDNDIVIHRFIFEDGVAIEIE